jgi:hypothetical protein
LDIPAEQLEGVCFSMESSPYYHRAIGGDVVASRTCHAENAERRELCLGVHKRATAEEHYAEKK